MTETRKITTSDKSVDNSGITQDYKKAIVEFISNGFDAKASSVNICYTANALGNIESFSITDNGEGINYEQLEETFGSFLTSNKKRQQQQRSSNVRGHRGKGRFSFIGFASRAVWETVYLDGTDKKEYKITIKKDKKESYDFSSPSMTKHRNTGTTVCFHELTNISEQHFNEEFYDFLATQFGWFLYLNKSKNYQLMVNGEEVEYEHLIAETEYIPLTLKEGITTYDFQISFIRWKKKIGDKSYFYFLNTDKCELAKELTTFNNGTTDYPHSLYIESDYFDNFVFEEEETTRIDGLKNPADDVYKQLIKELHNILKKKQQQHIKEIAAEDLIKGYELDGAFAFFKNNKYDQDRKSDLVNLIKGIYCVEPRIFSKLNTQQKKTTVGFLNLLLDSDEKENILNILESVITLTPEERSQLSKILETTALNKILRTIRMIENRKLVVVKLKELLFDHKRFTTERDHLQKIIEENYWLFGEQYHLVSADVNFEIALSEYLYELDGEKKKTTIDSDQRLRRPDIFMCRKHKILDSHNHSDLLEENVIVELKRPSCKVGIKQFRQIENYMELIKNEDQFNSQMRKWKFFVVSNAVDSFIKDQYTTLEDKNKRFLVQIKNQYEIYAMTWDDVFQLFEIRHSFILDKLNSDKEKMTEGMSNGSTPNTIVAEIRSINAE